MWLSFTNAAAASVPPRTERVAPTERTEHPAAPWRATRYALTGAEPGAAVVGAHTRETWPHAIQSRPAVNASLAASVASTI